MTREYLYNFFGLNSHVFIILNNLTNEAKNFVFFLKFFSNFFNIWVFSVYYFLIIILLVFRIKNINQDFRFEYVRKWGSEMIIVGVSYTIFGFLYAFLKFNINLPRPFCSLDVNLYKTIIDTSYERCLSSFPSSHSGIAFMISYFLFKYSNKKARIGLVLMTLLVALSRISLAMHYPSDILYGIAICYFVILISEKFCKIKFVEKLYSYYLSLIYLKFFK